MPEEIRDSDPPADGATRTRGSSSPGQNGGTIGPYRLLEKVGEGGMGEVWVAEQTVPLRRRVAVKIIKRGMDTEQVLARFEAERQALAIMDHPAIAKVLDAGETPEGRAYFVMEYVPGVPITEHCDRNQLPNQQRLELVVQVCAGVQHAHQKAIIHRDLKPSNVLVAIHDGKPVPKIIDFGVAKATAQRLTEKTLYTELGVMIGTPEYMSPEQAEMSGQGLDTRTDVYSLGVILYELLVGVLPFEPRDSRRASIDEIRRRIREEDPLRPSTRISSLGEVSTVSAGKRGTDPARLAGQLRGDLDWITMKALEKDPARRYGSPSDLAADILRYLNDEPVLARPPSASYRARKFVRRHRFGVAAGAVAILATLGFAIAMAEQARRIALERDRANREARTAIQVSRFLVDLFKVSDPGEARGKSITAREILDKGAGQIRQTLADQPEVQARLMDTMGRVFRNLGLYDSAESLLKDSLATQRRVSGADHPDTFTAMRELAIVYYYLARYDEAERLFRESLEGRRRVLGAGDAATLESMNALANLYNQIERYGDAEPLYVEALAAQRRLLGDDHPDTLKTMNNLASLCKDAGRYEQARPLAEEVLAARRRTLGADHPLTLNALQNVAGIYALEERYEKAEAFYGEAVESARRVLGDDSPVPWQYMNNLAELYRRQGRYAEAEPQLVPAADALKRLLGPDHPETLLVVDTLATVYAGMRKFDEAERLLQGNLESWNRVNGPADQKTLEARASLIGLYNAKGDTSSARSHLQRLIAARRSLAEAPGADAATLDTCARLLLTCDPQDLRDSKAALVYAQTATELAKNGRPEFLDTLALAYRRNGRIAEAIATGRRALSMLPPGKSELRSRIETAVAEYEKAAERAD